MIEIAPEAAGLDELLKIAVGGDDDAHVHGSRPVGADAFDLAFFEHAQQLGLHGGRHVADFVEEERAAMGLLKLANVPLRRAGERAFFMAEEFAFNQLCWNGGAVERDKGTGSAMALFVECAGHEFLACAGFAIDADTRLACGHALNLRHHALHGEAGKDQCVFAHAGAQVLIFGFETGKFEGILHGDEELLSGERLLKKVEGAETGGAHRHFNVRLAAHHDNGSGYARGLEIFKQREAVAAGHDDVTEDEVEGLGLRELKGARRVVAHHGFMACKPEGARERSKRVGFVVDDENLCLGGHDFVSLARGSAITNVAPLPAPLSTEMVPA